MLTGFRPLLCLAPALAVCLLLGGWESQAAAGCGDYLRNHGRTDDPPESPSLPPACPGGECQSAPAMPGHAVDTQFAPELRSPAVLSRLNAPHRERGGEDARPANQSLPEPACGSGVERPPRFVLALNA